MEELKPLNYGYDALEPYIDRKTMEIHHTKHHKTYIDKFNAAIEKYPGLKNRSAEELLKNIHSVPEEVKQTVINHGGGTYNHNFFWEILKKGAEPKGEILEEIKKTFGSYEDFKKQFSEAAATLFGSGWTWLVLNEKEIKIIQTKNQNSPISEGLIPLIALDVWEHAYYLKYQNKRPDYIEAFFNVINWENVNKIFLEAIK